MDARSSDGDSGPNRTRTFGKSSRGRRTVIAARFASHSRAEDRGSVRRDLSGAALDFRAALRAPFPRHAKTPQLAGLSVVPPRGFEVRAPWLYQASFRSRERNPYRSRPLDSARARRALSPDFHPASYGLGVALGNVLASGRRTADARGSRRRTLKRGGPQHRVRVGEVAASLATTCRRQRSGRCSTVLRMPRPTAARSATRSRSSRSSNSRRSGRGTRACRPSRAPRPSSACLR